MFSPVDLRSLLPESLAARVNFATLTDYDVVLVQTTTISGGSAAEGNSDPYNLESGYVFFHYARSGDIYTPAALTVAAGLVTAGVGQRWLWESTPSLNAANLDGFQMPSVALAGIQFKVNADVRSNAFQPFQTFCGPSAALPRLLPAPIVLFGQTPLSYRLQNNAPASVNARSNVVLHCLRANFA